MSYRIKLTETVCEIVRKFHLDLKKLIKKSFKEIAGNPYCGKELQEELEGYLSYRFKRYRVIYIVDEKAKTVIVHMVWHRRNIYELLSKLLPSK
ncbi:MAG: type II toxin-antitoxin system RelE/ParE family toxin [Desulfobulbaceae bacterium]|nr:type II toxin-antitoxin system RelE/ParE family toxin [Desulfobulbaceae bacterium]MCK5545594.1 type II toxin-antitoxin system RelE/ParE family toxin [Desulfobulbaceae bacterium]